jgi:hypothetical protein
MIQLFRPEAPSPLNETVFREYKVCMEAYLSDPWASEKPKSPGNYRSNAVIEAFGTAFHSKCYLTEEKFDHPARLEVDHFIPVGERPELEYHWENLFPISRTANSMRPKKTPEGGLLNPCLPSDELEKALVVDFNPSIGVMEFSPSNAGNLKAKNTAKLLNYLHNGDSKSLSTRPLIEALNRRYIEIANTVIGFREATAPNDRRKYLNQIKFFLSRRSAFTMVMRSIDIVQKFCIEHPEVLD